MSHWLFEDIGKGRVSVVPLVQPNGSIIDRETKDWLERELEGKAELLVDCMLWVKKADEKYGADAKASFWVDDYQVEVWREGEKFVIVVSAPPSEIPLALVSIKPFTTVSPQEWEEKFKKFEKFWRR